MKIFTGGFILILAVTVIALPQKRGKKPAPSQISAKLPVEVLNIALGSHRTEPAIILGIKNSDPSRTITKVICSIYVVDGLKLTVVKDYYSLNFRFPARVAPGTQALSVVTKSDDITVADAAHVPTACRSYASHKQFPDVLVPSDCKATDLLFIALVRVIYADGSEWVSKHNAKPMKLELSPSGP